MSSGNSNPGGRRTSDVEVAWSRVVAALRDELVAPPVLPVADPLPPELSALPAATAASAQELRPFTRLQSDSRQLTEADAHGTLFVAVRGGAFDAHSVLPTLAPRLAGAVGEEPAPAGWSGHYFQVRSSRRALGLLAHVFAGAPAHTLSVVGVTGTNGKSSTVRLLSAIFQAAGERVGWMSTVSQRIDEHESPQRLTTPEPSEIAAGLARFAARGGERFVMEISSHALDQERTAGIPLDGAILTNVTRDHLDYHDGWADYLAAKLRIFDALGPEGVAVFPHPRAEQFAALTVEEVESELACLRERVSGRVLTFGLDRTADVHPRRIAGDGDGQRGELSLAGTPFEFETRLIGRHNLANLLASAALAHGLGVSTDAIAAGFAAAVPVAGRLERVPSARGRVFVDYAHTPDALRAVLDSLRGVTGGRLRVVFGCGGDRDRGKRPEMGEIAESLADDVYVTSDNPRGEDPHAIIDGILAGMRNPARVQVDADRHAAIGRAVSDLEGEDTLVVAGKGHEREQTIGDRSIPFDDRAVVDEWLRRSDGAHPVHEE